MRIIQKEFTHSHYNADILEILKRLPGCGRISESSFPVFLDIETTGLSPVYSQVYLVGVCYPDPGGWHFVQWFCDTPSDERAVLQHVWELCGRASVLVHFNGDRFDIPFLDKRAQRCRLEADFLGLPSFDLIKPLRLAKPLLKLPDGRLKTWERFLGIGREDMYNGGELIEVYKQYVRDHDEEKLRLLLLHNEEDILAMPNFLPALAYTEIAKGRVKVLEVEMRENHSGGASGEVGPGRQNDVVCSEGQISTVDYGRQSSEVYSGKQSVEVYSGEQNTEIYFGEQSTEVYSGEQSSEIYSGRERSEDCSGEQSSEDYSGKKVAEKVKADKGHAAQWRVEFTTAARIPRPLFLTVGGITFYMKDNRISLTLPVFSGTMKYFFPNPKDYYYLPAEDEAIHKSVGSFVDKAHREQATAKTAYTHYTADFLPCFEGLPEVRLFYPEDSPQTNASGRRQQDAANSRQQDASNSRQQDVSNSRQQDVAARPQPYAPARPQSYAPARPQPYAAAQELQTRSTSWWEHYLREFLARA